MYWFCHTSLMGCTEGVFPASLEASPGPNSALDLGYTRSQLPPASLFKDTFLPGGLPATAWFQFVFGFPLISVFLGSNFILTKYRHFWVTSPLLCFFPLKFDLFIWRQLPAFRQQEAFNLDNLYRDSYLLFLQDAFSEQFCSIWTMTSFPASEMWCSWYVCASQSSVSSDQQISRWKWIPIS